MNCRKNDQNVRIKLIKKSSKSLLKKLLGFKKVNFKGSFMCSE